MHEYRLRYFLLFDYVSHLEAFNCDWLRLDKKKKKKKKKKKQYPFVWTATDLIIMLSY